MYTEKLCSLVVAKVHGLTAVVHHRQLKSLLFRRYTKCSDTRYSTREARAESRPTLNQFVMTIQVPVPQDTYNCICHDFRHLQRHASWLCMSQTPSKQMGVWHVWVSIDDWQIRLLLSSD